MLKLKAVRFEALTSLLYVVDQDENVYVIVDRGKSFDFISKPRFCLHTCSVNGEIRRRVEEPWIVIQGVENSVFPSGLSGNAAPNPGGKQNGTH